MTRFLFMLMLLAAMLMLPSPPEGQGAEGDAVLVRQVVLSRHGVRSPTQSESTLHVWSNREWPEWPVGRGKLTVRGAELVMRQWQEQRRHLEALGFFPPEGASPSQLFVYADRDERTQATAASILLALIPGQAVPYGVSSKPTDPLFHPVKAGVEQFDLKAVEQDILAAAGGSLDRPERVLAPEIRRIAAITGPMEKNFCEEHHGSGDCTLADIPTTLSFGEEGNTVLLQGRLGMASSIAEIFLLEYGQWPDRKAGWGEVDKDTLRQILPVHSSMFSLVNRTLSVARPRGGRLLKAMHAALTGTSSIPAVNAAKLIVLAGHDTNIAAVSGLLGLHWKLPDYPRDDIPPGSCLVLNLWNKNGTHLVTAEFMALSMDALHAARVPSDGILRTPLSLEHLSGEGETPFSCPLTAFTDSVTTLLEKD